MPRKSNTVKPTRIKVPDVDYAASLNKVFNKGDDNVNHPSHYSWLKELCGIEPIDILRHMDFDLGNAMKYILRCGRKGDEDKAIEDLEKAIFYIRDKIENLKQQQQ